MSQAIGQASSLGQLAVERPAVAWLRNARFDSTLIGGCALWAILAGVMSLGDRQLFLPLLALDIWLLGYQHVVATFTRLAFDSASARQHRFLLFGLPLVVAAVVVPIGIRIGAGVIATTYFYWQWFHYTRQSYGISRMYLRKSGAAPARPDLATLGVVYGLPLWGILRRSYQQPSTFLGLPVVLLPVPKVVLAGVAAVACWFVLLWVRNEVAAVRRAPSRAAYSAYLLSHILVFSVAYLAIDDINIGWLVVNIWHNAQYVLIVWLYNNNRFKRGIDPEHRFLSTISQEHRVLAYGAVCIGVATVAYLMINHGAALLATKTMNSAFLVYIVINFHHYVVDTIIWRGRKAAPARAVSAA